MLKAAIEKIESMVEPTVYEMDGHAYVLNSDGQINEIMPEVIVPKSKQLNSLDALVKMVKTEAVLMWDKVYINIPSHLSVTAFTNIWDCDLMYERPTVYEARATDVPGWEEETKLSFERAAVALQTRFQDSQDRTYTLQLLSQITTGAKVTYNDIGVATTIVTQKGIQLQQNATIRPLVKLCPYRTFQEIEQPECMFLIRIDERGISFVEADGGMWKLTARNTIKSYLETALKDEIETEKVIVML